MNDEELAAAGVPAGMIRISCGLEDKEDIIADLRQALEAAAKEA
jgi:O-acetylhomoserine (thiol)-lyase